VHLISSRLKIRYWDWGAIVTVKIARKSQEEKVPHLVQLTVDVDGDGRGQWLIGHSLVLRAAAQAAAEVAASHTHADLAAAGTGAVGLLE